MPDHEHLRWSLLALDAGPGSLGFFCQGVAAADRVCAAVAGERKSTGAGTIRDAGDALGVAKVEQGR